MITSTQTAPGVTNSDSYDYDRYGNRWHQNVTAGTGNTSSLACDAHIISSSVITALVSSAL